jgi:hypothetical protein
MNTPSYYRKRGSMLAARRGGCPPAGRTARPIPAFLRDPVWLLHQEWQAFSSSGAGARPPGGMPVGPALPRRRLPHSFSPSIPDLYPPRRTYIQSKQIDTRRSPVLAVILIRCREIEMQKAFLFLGTLILVFFLSALRCQPGHGGGQRRAGRHGHPGPGRSGGEANVESTRRPRWRSLAANPFDPRGRRRLRVRHERT